jgi:hypothetical protein
MTTQHTRQVIVLYREDTSKTWLQALEVQHLQFEVSHRDGLTTAFEAMTFGNLRSGGFLGELLTIEIHQHSTDVRYASKTMFEYHTDTNTNVFRVRANVRVAPLPVIPIEWRNLVLLQHNVLHYTGQGLEINPFLEVVSNGELRFEYGKVLGSQMVGKLQTKPLNPEQTWGRAAQPAMSVSVSSMPGKSWFDKLFRRI